MGKNGWIKIEDELPECNKEDIDREATYSEKVMTYSPVHGQEFNYGRKDEFLWPVKFQGKDRIRTTGKTFKWGVNNTSNDLTITHWRPLIDNP